MTVTAFTFLSPLELQSQKDSPDTFSCDALSSLKNLMFGNEDKSDQNFKSFFHHPNSFTFLVFVSPKFSDTNFHLFIKTYHNTYIFIVKRIVAFTSTKTYQTSNLLVLNAPIPNRLSK